MKTATVGIREAKANLVKYLRAVGQGIEVVLTHRGVPVGKTVPLGPEERTLEQRLNKLETECILGSKPDRNRRKQTWRFPLDVPRGSAQRFLQEDREHEGRREA